MVEIGRAYNEDDLPSEPISAFDAAAYIYQLASELAHLANGAALPELGRLLEAARERAAQDVIAAGRGRQGRSGSGDAA